MFSAKHFFFNFYSEYSSIILSIRSLNPHFGSDETWFWPTFQTSCPQIHVFDASRSCKLQAKLLVCWSLFCGVCVCVLAYMDQLLLRVVFFAAALPVAVGLVNGLGLLLTVVPVFILQVQGAAVMILWSNHWQKRHWFVYRIYEKLSHSFLGSGGEFVRLCLFCVKHMWNSLQPLQGSHLCLTLLGSSGGKLQMTVLTVVLKL